METQQKALISFDIGIKNLAVCVMSGPFIKIKKKKTASASVGVGCVGGPAGGEGRGVAQDTDEVVQEKLVIWDWRILSLVCDGEKCKSMKLDVLSQRIFKALEDLLERIKTTGCPEVSFVLIENQPSRINGTMKSIQMMIFSFFQYQRYKEMHGIKEVILVNARLKLQDHDIPIEFLPATIADAPSYKKNKDECVVYTNYYIRNDDVLRGIMSGMKKKDDVCDALLQGMAWLKKNQYTNQISYICSP
jgi:hypothetical protein